MEDTEGDNTINLEEIHEPYGSFDNLYTIPNGTQDDAYASEAQVPMVHKSTSTNITLFAILTTFIVGVVVYVMYRYNRYKRMLGAQATGPKLKKVFKKRLRREQQRMMSNPII
uniref:Protein LemA n=1 Tax=Lygus hesperus TaxID=30085 RepID=A0A0A9WGC3_LYGHE